MAEAWMERLLNPTDMDRAEIELNDQWMVVYHMFRSTNGAVALRETGEKTDVVPLRLDLANHSPDGFEWGYQGSGPAQLALALVADATGSDTLALRLYQRFKTEVVGRVPRANPWVVSRADIICWAEHQV